MTAPDPLTSDAAAAVLDQAARLGQSSLPLASGLRAAADEADSWRLSRALRHCAGQIERGQPLGDVLTATTGRLPPHLAGLVRAAEKSGALGSVLAEWLANRRAARQHWRTVETALAYPLIACGLTIGVYLFLAVVLVRPFRSVAVEFGLKLPANAKVLFWIGDVGIGWFVAALVAVGVMIVAWRVAGGRATWSWLVSQLPLVGPPWHWSGTAEMLRSLALLVEREQPLPEALRLAGGGASDAHVGKLAVELAGRIEQGRPLYLAVVEQRGLPLSIAPLLRVGEEQRDLAGSLRAAAEMLEGRLRVRTGLIVQIVPPLVFVAIGLSVLALYGLITSTLLPLMQGLM
ncbi:MAG: type II secretion system F family protein [Pirellulaceae bacterium]|nr:type II secretion system F family protein [Pirellulaceae bacterium]